MRRRAAEFRRPQRRRFSGWIWWLLAAFFVVGLFLFVIHHHHHEDHFRPPLMETSPEIEEATESSLNYTQELLRSTSFARQLTDQMALAKTYVVMAKEHNNLRLAWELSSQIRNSQRLLSQAAVRGQAVSLEEAHPIIRKLSQLIYKAQDSHYDISTTITTLKKHVQALEERFNAATVQSATYGELAAEAVPKNLHCLHVKLTMEWFRNPSLKKLAEEQRNSPRLVDNNLYHFCVFSDNVLATSVVVNSTVSTADHPQQFVFHVVTNRVNYQAMAAWFLMNDFKGCTVEVRVIEELDWLNASYSPLLKQLLSEEGTSKGEVNFRHPNAPSLLNHLRFYVPELLPLLEKVVFLDDDVVVQKDLTLLFSLDLHGNVNGAVETCLEAFHRFYKYLNFSNPLISSKFDPQACAWAFGMNIFDLIAWKKANLTARYHYWLEQNTDRMLWKTGTLPPGLLTFYGLVEPLDRRWHVLGLGYDMDIDDRLIESAAVLHFSGHLKPWMRLAIGRYKSLWERYINYSHPHLRDCIVH
ncbi:Polygalacturonate 4-alpha-galacturonosyltransferase protein [Dioscorea alata]|uniref:Polygalacturonate 4-alpha-galacturonosyltransferase protein n=1 Tax=Dioscorea alata TaxID=55571 RepID=A0ACB7UWB0_DIOAL|nr:Polygalacturonate 4-alpha-galacturonosyltransferase protein [Dioscorea alata]